MGLVAGIRRSVAKRGVSGTSVLAARLALSALSGRLLMKYLRHRAVRRDDAAFDARHGVETAGEVRSSDLRTDSGNKMYAAAYQPIDARHFQQAMVALGVRYEDYAFVDLGCGKGRALLLAADLPFRRIVGVEFDPVLAATATRNLERYPPAMRRATDIEVVCQDAARYELPCGPVLVYMYNPFEAPVMERVADNVRRSLLEAPRDIVVAYFTPSCAVPWSGVQALRRLEGSVDPAVYVSANVAGADRGA